MDNLLGLNYDEEFEKKKREAAALQQSISNNSTQMEQPPAPVPSKPEEEESEPSDSDEDIQYAQQSDRTPASETKKAMPLSQFLAIQRMIESNGGKNYNHAMIKSGMHKGTSAIGQYGLMPKTVDDLITRVMKSKDPEDLKIVSMPWQEKKAYLEAHPEIEDRLAKEYALQSLKRSRGAMDATLDWQWGQGRPTDPSKYTPAMKDRLAKFQQIKKKLNF
jgi:hypothetical protein